MEAIPSSASTAAKRRSMVFRLGGLGGFGGFVFILSGNDRHSIASGNYLGLTEIFRFVGAQLVRTNSKRIWG